MKRALIFLFLLAPLTVLAQATTSGTNLITNGGFERCINQDNVWDGVDAQGYLAGARGTAYTLRPNAGAGDIAMPVSVSAADLNGDRIIDLLVADPAGFFRVYFGSGSPTAPQFTQNEILPLYFGRAGNRDNPKVALFDLGKRNVFDMVVGVYSGEVIFLPNRGGAAAPQFVQPATKMVDYPKMATPTTRDGRLWCNLATPAVWDFNEDGRPDLLLGEGSYSANAIHLLLNQGTGVSPKFTEDARYYLVYGDGREVLTPTVVDYNGDGAPDVLVGASDGKICAYLHPGRGQWKPGTELKFASEISFGGSSNLGGVVAPCAADFNNDGLFDLLIGKNTGRIALALNTGTKQQPKFGRPVELKGVDLWARDNSLPSGWSADVGWRKGNLYGLMSAVGPESVPPVTPPEGKQALRIGYCKPLNKITRFTPLDLEPKDKVAADGLFYFDTQRDASGVNQRNSVNVFVLSRPLSNVKPEVSYTLSFKVQGQGFSGNCLIGMHGSALRAPEKIERLKRGAAKVKRDESVETLETTINIPSSAVWTTVSRPLSFKFKDALLNSKERWEEKYPGMGKSVRWNAVIHFVFAVQAPDGFVLLDDVQLVEKTP